MLDLWVWRGVPEKQKFLQNFVVIADTFDFNGSIP